MDAPLDSRVSVYRPYHFALSCGALPLVMGISVFLLWLLTGWDWLMAAGVCVLVAGSVLFLIGVFELAQFSYKGFRSPDLPRRRLWLLILGCGTLLFANFPVASGVIATVNTIVTSYTVIVHNEANETLYGVEVIGGGSRVTLGTISPGEHASDRLWFKKDGALEFHATTGSISLQQTIADYVSNGSGGKAIVTVNSDRTISIKRERR